MKKTILFFIILLLFYLSWSQTGTTAAMFRNNPAHTVDHSTGNKLVLDTKAWRLDAGSPVRSTPLVSGGYVYIGTTAGDFFALDKKTGGIKWKYHSGFAINSSAAAQNGRIFFSDNAQTLYALNEGTGRVLWSFKLGTKLDYPWRFDYYYSSPVLFEGRLIIGSDDGNLYLLDQQNGKLIWKFKGTAVIRGTPAVFNDQILFGDVEGRFHAIDSKSGKEKWVFKTVGDSLKNEDWGFDRKAILSSAVVSQNKILFGCRDGFLYCLNATDGKLAWRMNHKISWVISTVAVKDSMVVTGTSDGRFVQAINLNTGKEIWKFRTSAVVWSSPLIIDDVVYAADFDGQLYCLDLKTGKRISQFWCGDKIMSSPVYDEQLLYVGSDDGYLYALKGQAGKRFAKEDLKRFVFYDANSKNYFQSGSDTRIKEYLQGNGFKAIGPDTIEAVLSQNAANTSIVFASNYFPAPLIQPAENSLLRKFLDGGGRIVLLGANSLVYKLDEKTKQPNSFNVPLADSVLGINYGPNDTRSFGGQFACFATEKGKEFGLPDFWTALLFLKPEQVDVVLGKNENGLVSAFAKYYKNGGRFVQVYYHPRLPENLDAIIKLAEWDL